MTKAEEKTKEPQKINVNDLKTGIGERIRALRYRKGWLQSELAAEINRRVDRGEGGEMVSPSWCSNVELGNRLPSVAILAGCALALDTSVDYLVGFPDADPKVNTDELVFTPRTPEERAFLLTLREMGEDDIRLMIEIAKRVNGDSTAKIEDPKRDYAAIDPEGYRDSLQRRWRQGIEQLKRKGGAEAVRKLERLTGVKAQA